MGCLDAAGLAVVFPATAFAVHLEFVAEVRGTILDVTPKRILYSVQEDGQERLRILDRSSGVVQAVPGVPGREPVNGVLTSRGTFFRSTDGSVINFYEWYGGTPRLREGETVVGGLNRSASASET